MSKPVVWFDADGVLLDFMSPFTKLPEFTRNNVKLSDIKDYDLAKYFGEGEVGKARFKTALADFYATSQFASLDLLVNPVLLIALKQAGYELRVITKVPEGVGRHARRLNLAQYGDVFSEVIIVDPNTCKVNFLRQWQHLKEPSAEYIVIEDDPNFLWSADVDNAFTVYGIRHTYNQYIEDKLENVWMYNNTKAVIKQLITLTGNG